MRGVSLGWSLGLMLSVLGALSSGCAKASLGAAKVGTRELLSEAKARGLPYDDPLYISERTKAEVDEAVSRAGAPEERLRALVHHLTDSGHVKFVYQPDLSLTAEEAYRQRRGDCMSFTNLFMALSRHMGMATYFVHVHELRNYYERSGWFFVSSHVAVGFSKGPTATVFDFNKELTDWRMAVYESISDADAVALYYNNIAVDHMVRGRTEQAEELFSFWMPRAPGVAELYNNYGVLLNRTGRSRKALSVLMDGIKHFPSYEPLYTNGMLAARSARELELGRWLEVKSESLAERDPFFLFARAMDHYQHDRYVQAAEQLERARAAKPDSAVILAWLTRSYLSAGRHEEGREAFEQMRSVPVPDEKLERDLKAQFPELRQVGTN